MAIRARVESVIDPLKLGRIKIRVPGLHGDSAFTPTEALPWASYVDALGGGFDNGSFALPEVGSTVLAEKEENSSVWFYYGVVRGTGTVSARGQETKWLTDPDKPEVPHDTEGDYKKSVIYKSIKGATIRIDDSEGNETLDILGHNGTTIRIITPLGKYEGHKSSRNGQSIDTTIGTGESCVVVKDGSGNIMRMMSGGVMEFVGNGTIKSGINLNSTSGNLSAFVQAEGSRSELSLTSNQIVATNGKSSIKMLDGIIEMDGDSLIARFDNIALNAGDFDLNSSSGNLTGDSIRIGGGTVDIGPTTNLGASVSKGSIASKVIVAVGSWVNNVLKKYGGDEQNEGNS